MVLLQLKAAVGYLSVRWQHFHPFLKTRSEKINFLVEVRVTASGLHIFGAPNEVVYQDKNRTSLVI
jgi:hypothetical protein